VIAGPAASSEPQPDNPVASNVAARAAKITFFIFLLK
jgi:hypothetical protein